ncbi:hypothetical protein [Streptomyces sp. NPDC101150]|uniref:hypothetical protein n=1 Tax=Streptomyces sp. NPDC101150 TaxID=3366114 RepID=UPI00382C4918
MRARYRSDGLWGLVDGRAVRERSAVGRADERVVAAVRKVLEGQRERSTGTLVRLRRRVGWLLEEEYGAGAVALPPASTFNRLVHAVADGQGLLGTAAQRRRHASRPAPPFTPTVALRPGEMVMLDSTPLDVLAVLAVLDDGVTGRLEDEADSLNAVAPGRADSCPLATCYPEASPECSGRMGPVTVNRRGTPSTVTGSWGRSVLDCRYTVMTYAVPGETACPIPTPTAR